MAKLRLEKIKPLVALAAFLLFWWILPASVKSFTRLSFAEFHAPAWLVTTKIDQLSDFWAARNHSKGVYRINHDLVILVDIISCWYWGYYFW